MFTPVVLVCVVASNVCQPYADATEPRPATLAECKARVLPLTLRKLTEVQMLNPGVLISADGYCIPDMEV